LRPSPKRPPKQGSNIPVIEKGCGGQTGAELPVVIAVAVLGLCAVMFAKKKAVK